MQSYLIVGNNTLAKQAYIASLITDNSIDPFDITRITTDEAIGIDEIRTLQKKIFLKPLKSEKKLIIIDNAHTITVQGQNALLKTLEEPPPHTFILLVAPSDTSFLPTIVSRTTIVSFFQEHPQEIYDEPFLTTITEALTGNPGKQLVLAQVLSKDKTTITTWIEKGIYFLREQLRNNPHPFLLISLTNFHYSWQLLQTTNLSSRSILEQLFFSLTQHREI